MKNPTSDVRKQCFAYGAYLVFKGADPIKTGAEMAILTRQLEKHQKPTNNKTK